MNFCINNYDTKKLPLYVWKDTQFNTPLISLMNMDVLLSNLDGHTNSVRSKIIKSKEKGVQMILPI